MLYSCIHQHQAFIYCISVVLQCVIHTNRWTIIKIDCDSRLTKRLDIFQLPIIFIMDIVCEKCVHTVWVGAVHLCKRSGNNAVVTVCVRTSARERVCLYLWPWPNRMLRQLNISSKSWSFVFNCRVCASIIIIINSGRDAFRVDCKCHSRNKCNLWRHWLTHLWAHLNASNPFKIENTV